MGKKKKKKGLKRAANGALVPAKGYRYGKGGRLVKTGGYSVNGLGSTGAKSRASMGEKGIELIKISGGVTLGIIAGRVLKNLADGFIKPTGMMQFISPVLETGIGTAVALFTPRQSFSSYVGMGMTSAGMLDLVNVGIGQFSGTAYQVDNLKVMEIFKDGSTIPGATTETVQGLGQVRYLQLPGAVNLPLMDKTTTILGTGSIDPDKIL